MIDEQRIYLTSIVYKKYPWSLEASGVWLGRDSGSGFSRKFSDPVPESWPRVFANLPTVLSLGPIQLANEKRKTKNETINEISSYIFSFIVCVFRQYKLRTKKECRWQAERREERKTHTINEKRRRKKIILKYGHIFWKNSSKRYWIRKILNLGSFYRQMSKLGS